MIKRNNPASSSGMVPPIVDPVEPVGPVPGHQQSRIVAYDQPDVGTGDFNLNVYHPYDEIAKYMRSVEASYPEFVHYGSLGDSYEGREIPYLRVGYPSHDPDGLPKPGFFLDAGIHAREWIAPAVALHFINRLVTNMTYRPVLKNIDVYVVPSLNPDGYVYTWTK